MIDDTILDQMMSTNNDSSSQLKNEYDGTTDSNSNGNDDDSGYSLSDSFMLATENVHKVKSKYFGNPCEEQAIQETTIMLKSFLEYQEIFESASSHLYTMGAFDNANDDYFISSVYDDLSKTDDMNDFIYEAVTDIVKNAKHNLDKNVDRVDRAVADKIMKMNDDIKDDIRSKYVERVPFKLSKIIKMALGVGALWAINPAIAAVGAVVSFAMSKKANAREKDRLISEIREERSIVEEKIKDSDNNGDKNKKYQLMRLKISLDRAEKRLITGLR